MVLLPKTDRSVFCYTGIEPQASRGQQIIQSGALLAKTSDLTFHYVGEVYKPNNGSPKAQPPPVANVCVWICRMDMGRVRLVCGLSLGEWDLCSGLLSKRTDNFLAVLPSREYWRGFSLATLSYTDTEQHDPYRNRRGLRG